jgi:hypothetical protein
LGYFHDINNDNYDSSNNDSNDGGGAKKTKSMARNIEEKHNLLLRMVSTYQILLGRCGYISLDGCIIKSDIRFTTITTANNNNKCKKTTNK